MDRFFREDFQNELMLEKIRSFIEMLRSDSEFSDYLRALQRLLEFVSSLPESLPDILLTGIIRDVA
jgi:hypothetical protein